MLGRPPRREGPPSLSGLVWLAGVRGVDARLGDHTVLFPEDYEAEFRDIRAGRHPRDPTLSVTITSRSDPSDAPAGHENRFVMANAPALATPEPATARREADEAEGGRSLRDALARHGFDPADRVVVERWLAPAAFAAFGHRGSLYGAAPHGALATLRPTNAVAGVANAALAGGTVHPGGGVPLAMLSGRFAASLVAARLGLARRRGA
jgi:phytoene dehydrogenase-like protein